MKHMVMGTAGHVDHGKTVLVKALTGMNTDRLKEEQKRGISIELGFANFNLPSGQSLSVIDVPGHERFIKNMLAGVGGIDLVMLVVAADEGIMPQTQEHLDIIQLLQIKKGIVVLTKKDLVDDEWLDLVQEDVTAVLHGTVLENAPILAVSALTGENMDLLLQTIDTMVLDIKEKNTAGLVRLPVDRVFSVVGFGTVVTGTLISGQINVGSSVQLYPSDLTFRVRNLHVHGHKVEQAKAGQRVAVNLTGAEKSDISRGFVLATPGSLKPSHRLDVKLQLLPSAPRPLPHRARVRIHLGAAEILGRVIMLDREELLPGAATYVQLQLENKVAAARGDHFVIRSYSPMRTVGGGIVLDATPRRHKRYRPEVLAFLAKAEQGTPDLLIEQYLVSNATMAAVGLLSKNTGLDEQQTKEALAHLLKIDAVTKLVGDGENYYLSAGVLTNWQDKLAASLDRYHQTYPLRPGYPKEELRMRLFSHLNTKQWLVLTNYWQQNQQINLSGSYIADFNFKPQLTAKMQQQTQQLLQLFATAALMPPEPTTAMQQVGVVDESQGQELWNYLFAQGLLIKIAENIYLHPDVLQQAITLIQASLTEKGRLTLGDVRDLLQTSRKYTLPLLEYLDQQKITRRVGDDRVPGRLFRLEGD